MHVTLGVVYMLIVAAFAHESGSSETTEAVEVEGDGEVRAHMSGGTKALIRTSRARAHSITSLQQRSLSKVEADSNAKHPQNLAEVHTVISSKGVETQDQGQSRRADVALEEELAEVRANFSAELAAQKAEVEKLAEEELGALRAEVKALKAEVAAEADVKPMEAEVEAVKADVKALKTKVDAGIDGVGLHCKTSLEDIKTNMSELDCVASSAGISLAHWKAPERNATLQLLEESLAAKREKGESITSRLIADLTSTRHLWDGPKLSVKGIASDISVILRKFNSLKTQSARGDGVTPILSSTAFVGTLVTAGASVLSLALPGVGTMLAAAASIGFSFFGKSQSQLLEDMAEMMQAALQNLYNKIMREVETFVNRAVLEAQMTSDLRSVQNQLSTVCEEISWVPDLLSAAAPAAGPAAAEFKGMLAWLLMIQHNLAELKTPVLNVECLQLPVADGISYETTKRESHACKLWQGKGTLVEGIIYGQLHFSIMTQIAALNDAYIDPITERIDALSKVYYTMLYRSMDMWKVSKHCIKASASRSTTHCSDCLHEWFPLRGAHMGMTLGCYRPIYESQRNLDDRCYGTGPDRDPQFAAPFEKKFRGLVDAFSGTAIPTDYCVQPTPAPTPRPTPPRRRSAPPWWDEDWW